MPRTRPLLFLSLPLLLVSMASGRAHAQADDEPAEPPTETPAEQPTDETPAEQTTDQTAADAPESASETGGRDPDAASEESAAGASSPAEADADAETAQPEIDSSAQPGPKVAVILVGDPDDRLREWASRVERALEADFERPFDPMLRSALRGGLGDPEDGFAEVRRERRRLGLSEAEDIPVLSRLGRRAGAVAIAVVRRGDAGPEVVVMDVRQASFYEGSLVLSDAATPARVSRFVGARARSAARGTAELPPVTAPPAATEADPESEDEEEPDFFERYWPYGAAIVLLGAFVAVIAVTASTDGGDQPVLRFVPGGR